MEEKPKGRFWVSLGNWDLDGLDEITGKRCQKVKAIIEEKIPHTTGDNSGGLVLKTWNFDEAIQARDTVIGILEKEWPDSGVIDGIGITRQPQCAKCGELAPFGSAKCRKCKSVLGGPAYY